jgi:hypothetical protein
MRHSILILLLFLSQLCADVYQLGQGIKVPHVPLYIGGYATADYLQRTDDYHRVRVDELALIAYGGVDRLSYLGEIEMKESYSKEWGKVESETYDDRVSIERLYMDYAFNDNLSLRVGKLNTPVGYWNLEPINVLRDSASNPYLAYIVYPKYTTGMLVSYADTLNSDTTYSLLLQENSDLDDGYNNISVNRHYSGGVEHYLNDALSIKANIGHFRTTDELPFYYFLAALQYEEDDYKISAEYGARRGETDWSVPYALYVQGVWHLKERHDLIGRFEHYKIDEGALRDEQIGVFGYTYRPIYPVTLKAEYQAHSYSNENQVHLSFSVMF